MAYICAEIVIGIIHFVAAYGLFRGMSWSWYLAVIGCCGHIIIYIIFVVYYFHNVFSFILLIGCLFLLYKVKAKEHYIKK